MEAKLYRLTILISIFAAFASNNNAEGFQRMFSLSKDIHESGKNSCPELMDNVLMVKCKEKFEDFYLSNMTSDARGREEANAKTDNFVAAAVFIPISLFLLFFSTRWIITGRIRK